MYSQNNNAHQIINMYTVTKKTTKCIKNSGLDNRCIFQFLPKFLSKHFSLR